MASHPSLGLDPRLNLPPPPSRSPLHHSAGPLEHFPLPSLRGESAPSSLPPTPPGVRPPSTRGPPQPGPQRWHPLFSRPPALSPLILLAGGIVAPCVLALSALTSDDPVSSAFLIPFDPLAPRGLFVPSNITPRRNGTRGPLLFASGGLSSGSLVLASSPRLRPWSLSSLALSGALLPLRPTQPPFGLFLSQRRQCLFQFPSLLSLVPLFPSCSLPPSRFPLPPIYPDFPPGPALSHLATPASHSQLCHFFPYGMEVLGWDAGHLSPSPLVCRCPFPGMATTCSPPQPHQPWSATRRRNQPIPNFPVQGPKDHNPSLLFF